MKKAQGNKIGYQIVYSLIFLSCDSNHKKKCSRVIFVNSNGGKGIHFLNGHGILLSVSNIFLTEYRLNIDTIFRFSVGFE